MYRPLEINIERKKGEKEGRNKQEGREAEAVREERECVCVQDRKLSILLMFCGFIENLLVHHFTHVRLNHRTY